MKAVFSKELVAGSTVRLCAEMVWEFDLELFDHAPAGTSLIPVVSYDSYSHA